MANLTVSQVLQDLERRAPSDTAEDWDNVGLLAGDPSWKTSGAVVTVDLTEQAIRLAKQRKYRLIVNHHPCIFPRSRGLSRVVAGMNRGGTSGLVFEAIRQGIAVIACHTNFDRCAMEVVQSVSEGLGVTPKGRLVDHPGGSLVKLVVFVPLTHVEQVREAICQAGAGKIGNYDFCTFGAEGEGSFRGGESTRPFLGKPGKLEKAREIRLETIFPQGLEKPVLGALFRAHPYEEVAYDLYPVKQGPASEGLVRGLGYGFWGEFPSPKSFSEVAKDVTSLFNVNGFLLSSPLSPEPRSVRARAARPSTEGSRKIRRIGFVAGNGSSFLSAAAAAGCDLYITGEVGYHPALDGTRKGMKVMELGHTESEYFFPQTVKGWLSQLGLKSEPLYQPAQQFFGRSI